MKRSISIFGATGSVGTSTLNLLRQKKDMFEVIAMTCNDNIEEISKLANEFKPKIVAISNKKKLIDLKNNISPDIKCFGGQEGVIEAASYKTDISVASIVIGKVPTTFPLTMVLLPYASTMFISTV